MRYMKSVLVGLGMYALAVAIWDEFGWLYVQYYWRHQLGSGEISRVLGSFSNLTADGTTS